MYVGSDEGLKISNAKGVLLNNVIVNAKSSPALMVEDVSDIEIDRFRDPEPDPNLPVIEFENVAGAFIQSCTAVEGTGTFLELKGESNREIRLSENRLSEASKKVEFTGGASEGALIKPK